MRKEIYQEKQFKIYEADSNNGSNYIVQNTEIGEEAHTHLKNFKTCLYVIELSLNKRIPRDLPKYLLQSLYRVNCGEYQQRIGELLENKRWVKKYINVNKGVKKK